MRMKSVDLSSTSQLLDHGFSAVLSWHSTCDMTGRSTHCQDSFEDVHGVWLAWALSVGVGSSLAAPWIVLETCLHRVCQQLWVGSTRELCADPWLRGVVSSRAFWVFATYSSPQSSNFCLTCCPVNAWADSGSAIQPDSFPNRHALCTSIPFWRHDEICSHHTWVDLSDLMYSFDSSALVSVDDFGHILSLSWSGPGLISVAALSIWIVALWSGLDHMSLLLASSMRLIS